MFNNKLKVERIGDSGSAPEGLVAAEAPQWYFLQRSCSRGQDREKGMKYFLPGTESSPITPVVLTDMVILPHVAHDHITSQHHSYTANTTFLHVDIFVVVSGLAWNRQQEKPQK